MNNKLSRCCCCFFFFFSHLAALTFSLRQLSSGHHCDPNSLPTPQALRSDQLTVLINGYSESRIPLLTSIAAQYSSSAFIAAVVILWGNPSTPQETLTQLSQNLSIFSHSDAPISIFRQSSSSLNNRFLPRPWITTRAVLICDDDVQISEHRSLEFAFKVWNSNRDRLVGFFARSHEIDLESRSWIYTVHPDKYSILLTKIMILRVEYLFKYSCDSSMAEARRVVDEMRNCEDILMNFVAAIEGNGGPILAGADNVRDWGDARNDNGGGIGGEVRDVGLSSRRGEHRKRRGECINRFHRVLERMPLRYSYGKIVHSVGEQGLCQKGGKLVFCDQ